MGVSSTNFQERLARIEQSGTARGSVSGDAPVSVSQAAPPSGGINYGKLMVGSFLVSFAGFTIKSLNEQYELYREALGVAGLAATFLVMVVLFITGCALSLKALRGKKTATPPKAKRTASSTARTVWSLVGLSLGGIAVFYIFVSQAVSTMGTEKALQIATGGYVIAVALALVSGIFAFLALVLRGRGLGRVPVYFLLGALLTFVTMHQTDANVLEWDHFLASAGLR